MKNTLWPDHDVGSSSIKVQECDQREELNKILSLNSVIAVTPRRHSKAKWINLTSGKQIHGVPGGLLSSVGRISVLLKIAATEEALLCVTFES